jgi:hypothetical protein
MNWIKIMKEKLKAYKIKNINFKDSFKQLKCK